MDTMIDIVEQYSNLPTYHAIIMLQMVNYLLILGKRYLDFPTKKYCCYCCDSAHGCGIVKRDWLKTANATYMGT